MSNSNELTIVFKGDTSDALGKTNGLKGALGGLGDLAGGALKVGLLGAAAGGVALASGLGAAVQAAMETEEGQAQLAAVLASTAGKAGVTAKQANALASSLQNVTRYEDDTILATESLLLTFTNIGKDVFPQVTETALDMATAMGTDTKSAAIQLGKALNDPVNGMTALTRVGVTFTDAQKEQIKALQESGDLMGAQKVILKELATEFGGAARAAGDTFAGKLDILNHKFGDIMETIGGALIPVLSAGADALLGFLNGPEIQAVADGIASIFSDLAAGNFEGAFATIREGLANLVPPEVLDALGNIGQTAIDGMSTFKVWLDENAPLIQAQVIAMGQGIKDWSIENGPTLFSEVETAITNLGGMVSAAFFKMPEDAKTSKQQLDEVLTTWNVVMDLHGKQFQIAQTKIADGWNAIQRAIGRATDDKPITDFNASLDAWGLKLPTSVQLFNEFATSMETLANDIAAVLNGIAWAIDNIARAAKSARDFFGGSGGGTPPPPNSSGAPFERFGGGGNFGGGRSFGGEMTINLNYAPVVSLMDESEAQTRLAPFVREAVRAAMGA